MKTEFNYTTLDPRLVRLNELEKAYEEKRKEHAPISEAYNNKRREYYLNNGLYYEDTPVGKNEKSKVQRLAKKCLEISAEIISLKRELGVF